MKQHAQSVVKEMQNEYFTVIEDLLEVVEFYASCPERSGMIESIINGGEFIPVGDRARTLLKKDIEVKLY